MNTEKTESDEKTVTIELPVVMVQDLIRGIEMLQSQIKRLSDDVPFKMACISERLINSLDEDDRI
jgi:hypothetical protein